jgi:hypothetical protein
VAVADYPMDILWSPLSWANGRYKNIVQYTRFTKGGHFPALEVPDSVVEDLQRFAEKLKTEQGAFPMRPPAVDKYHAEREHGEKASADEEL